MSEQRPKPAVSVILPTLNEGARIEGCLASIRNQRYPQNRVEILVADGGSTDATVQIAERFGARVIDAADLLAEAAKEKALAEATGDYLAMIDADNTIRGEAWLETAIDALEKHPEALGFESYYPFEPSDPPINRYLTGLLQISDPWARCVARSPELMSQDPDGLEILELPADGAYPTGANGFVFPRRHLESLGSSPFHEATFFPHLIRGGRRVLLKNPRAQVHHDYVRSWRDFFAKKQRVALHYLLRQGEVSGGWDAQLPAWRKWGAMLYCASVLGPAVEGLAKALRHRRLEWLLHPVASWLAVVATFLGIGRSLIAGSRENRASASRSLKPKGPSGSHRSAGSKQ